MPHVVSAGRRALVRFFPFLSWIGELRHPQTLRADLIAGITVADNPELEYIISRVTQALHYAWDQLGDRYDRTTCPLRSPAGG